MLGTATARLLLVYDNALSCLLHNHVVQYEDYSYPRLWAAITITLEHSICRVLLVHILYTVYISNTWHSSPGTRQYLPTYLQATHLGLYMHILYAKPMPWDLQVTKLTSVACADHEHRRKDTQNKGPLQRDRSSAGATLQLGQEAIHQRSHGRD